jgi:hypothetical protein
MRENENLIVGEGDYINPSLTSRFPDVRSLLKGCEGQELNWFGSVVDRQFEVGVDALIDFGPDTSILQDLARPYPLSDVLDGLGIDVVMVFVFGPSIDDIAYLKLYEHLLRPQTIILALNEGAVLVPGTRSPISMPGHSTAPEGDKPARCDGSFRKLMEHPEFRAVVEGGGHVASIPLLLFADKFWDSGLSFTSHLSAIEKGGASKAFGLMEKLVLRRWLEEMDQSFELVLPLIMPPRIHQLEAGVPNI